MCEEQEHKPKLDTSEPSDRTSSSIIIHHVGKGFIQETFPEHYHTKGDIDISSLGGIGDMYGMLNFTMISTAEKRDDNNTR